MIRLLASVQDAEEADIAVLGGADIIDFKDPAHGALGALPVEVIEAGVRRVARRTPTSATAGDWPLDPGTLTHAAECIAATGVDFVKLGLLPGAALAGCVDALAPLAARHRTVAVFFGDRGVPLQVLPRLCAAGFAGAMIDTFDKGAGSLRQHLDDATLRAFVERARELGLMTGLAGSLRVADIAPLTAVGPDLLGFRGALCRPGGRAMPLSLEQVRAVREALNDAAAGAGEPQRRTATKL
jgi:(5-formylfuran-3-yl)methyl phosphate synthase